MVGDVAMVMLGRESDIPGMEWTWGRSRVVFFMKYYLVYSTLSIKIGMINALTYHAM